MTQVRSPALWCRLAASPAAWPYGGLALLLAVLFWPAWTEGERLISNGDALLIHYPWFVLWRDLLAEGEPPFWNPYTFGGIPAWPTMQAGFGYPPHWLVTWLPPVRAMNWMLGLHVLLGGLGAAWSAGRLGASPNGQVLSGASYALGSALATRLWAGHLSFVEANAWLPVATGVAVQIGQRRAVVVLASIVGMMALAGQPEVLIFALWWLPIWAVAGASREPNRRVFRALVRIGLAIGLGIAVAAFQLLPLLEFATVSNRQASISWDFQTSISLQPWHLLTAITPYLYGDPRESYWPGPAYEWHERLLYVGLVPLFAAGAAGGRWRRVCWGLAGVAVLLAFGRYLPGYHLTQILPGYDSFRIPAKHLVLASLALALAAGLGLERLQGRRIAWAATVGAVLAAVAALSAGLWLPPLASVLADPTRVNDPAVQGRIVGAGAAGLGWAAATMVAVAGLARLPSSAAQRGMLALALVELSLMLRPYHLHLTLPSTILVGADGIEGHARAVVVGPGGPLFANQGPVLKVVQPGGYVSLFSSGYMLLASGTVTPGVVLDFASTDDPALALLGYGVIVDQDRSLVIVHEPPPVQVWVARCAWPGGALEARRPDFPHTHCVTRQETAVPDPPVPPGPASILDDGPGRLTVEAEGPGWLATRMPWYPGWVALIDGAPASVEIVNGALVGVPLPAGRHTVKLWYRPAGLDLGLAISGAAVLVLVVAWWADRRRPACRTGSAVMSPGDLYSASDTTPSHAGGPGHA